MKEPSESIVSSNSLRELLAAEDALVQEASEALPHRFDVCTHSLGYIRQAVYWCRTCADPRGLCSACSIACHGDHEQVELFPKRAFRCDCPTSSLAASCHLHRTLEEPNGKNAYGQNFAGQFCRCGRLYDPTVETETMLQCHMCEDWYHESCLHLRNESSSASHASDEDSEEDEDNDPTLVLKPSDFDAMICSSCARKSSFLTKWAGTPGIRMIVWRKASPLSSDPTGKWTILGNDVSKSSNGNADEGEDVDVDVDSLPDVNVPKELETEALESITAATASKRSLSDLNGDNTVSLRPTKRPRISSVSELETSTHVPCTTPAPNSNAQSILAKPMQPALSQNVQTEDGAGEGDLFLSHGWRKRWCRCPNCLPYLEQHHYLIEEEELYEPPEDPDSTVSLEELGMRALENLPRDKALDGIRAYNDMRDDLLTYLRPFASEGRVVSENDMKSFFAERLARLKSST